MNLAARIYDKVRTLPEHAASEVLDFAEFLASRQTEQTPAPAVAKSTAEFFSRFNADLSQYRFDREEANER